jgi:hypothetical protein
MNSLKIPSQHLWAALLLATATAGCVSPHVEGLAQAECASASDCAPDSACVEGACIACGPEICDGLDNDCDGQIDEDFDLQTDAAHCGACGVVCDLRCEDGQCNDCDPHEEICNGSDDDCDGEIDEGVLNACGACGAVPEEICNGEDDDCDGQIDEAVTNACGTCGPAPEERCNGEDDDCDGQIDEIFEQLGQACAAGEGVCIAEGQWICGDADTLICDAQPGEPEPAERCDAGHAGVDDDCDGQVDEGVSLGEVCGVGIGQCFAEGHTVCDEADPTQVVCIGEPGEPVAERCDGEDNDCDGVADNGFDLASDADHCGACGNACAFENGHGICLDSACVLEVCQPPFQDLDQDPANGCECNEAALDAPDPSFVDFNCDGVDGEAEASVFVSPAGGRRNGTGTIDDPVNTIEAALTLVTPDRPAVLLEEGTYPLEAALRLRGLVRLHGGYVYDLGEPDFRRRWSRKAPDETGATVLSSPGADPALIIEDGATVRLDNLLIEVHDDVAGNSLVGIATRACTEIILSDVVLIVADRAPSEPSEPTRPADDAAGPGALINGALEGGSGGTNPACPGPTEGGRGGAGSPAINGAEFGFAGGAGAAGGQSAEGGRLATAGADGARPVDPDGRPGQPGLPAGQVNLNRLIWQPHAASAAGAGRPGGGGGGGGGGHGDGAGTPGRGGAGGGAGGCGGVGGTAGLPGGSSIGLLLGGAQCRVSLVRTQVLVGQGAEGGVGQPGSEGAAGAPGAAEEQPISLQSGGAGGHGASGGCGGAGASGNGGHSLGILVVEAARMPTVGPESIIEVGGVAAPGAPVPAGICPEGLSGFEGQSLETACCPIAGDCGGLRCQNLEP